MTAARGHSLLRNLSNKARLRRWEEFTKRFPNLENMRVLDLGGTLSSWEAAPVRPKHVTLVNLNRDDERGPGDWYEFASGDACNLPPELADQSFDLVYCNSLIEHVGGHSQRRLLAHAIMAAAPHYWVQTPYRYFPVEPHWMMPFMHLLPIRVRAAVAKHLPFGPAHKWTPQHELIDAVSYVELLSATEMRDYFPEAELWFERSMGLPKSLVSIRS